MLSKRQRRSFDRFDDQLAETLLSYLPIAIAFLYEPVCWRWQRVIYTRHRALHLWQPVTTNQFQLILRKCVHVERVTIPGQLLRSDMFETLARLCPQLRALDVEMAPEGATVGDIEALRALLTTHGHRLAELRCELSGDRATLLFLKRKLKLFGNLREVLLTSMGSNKTLSTLVGPTGGAGVGAKNRVPLLPYLCRLSIGYKRDDWRRFHSVMTNYGHSLRRLSVQMAECCDAEAIYRLIMGLLAAPTLRALDLKCDQGFEYQLLVNGLRNVYNCTPALIKLTISFALFSCHSADDLLEVIGLKFGRQLRRLEVHGLLPKSSLLNLEPLYLCPSLTHLTINTYMSPSDHVLNLCYYPVFGRCHELIPGLRHLSLSNIECTYCLMRSLARLSRLQTLAIGTNGTPDDDCLLDIITNHFVDNCPKITHISINERNLFC